METNKLTIEKILGDALELREKGVSLHAIVNTYPDHKEEIEDMFSTIGTLSKEREAIRVPQEAFERMLRALPEAEFVPAPSARNPIRSPFATIWTVLQSANWRYVVPVAAIAILSGGLILSRNNGSAPTGPGTVSDSGAQVATLAGTAPSSTDAVTPAAQNSKMAVPAAGTAPAAMMMSAASTPTDRTIAMLSQESANEANAAKGYDSERSIALRDAQLLADPTARYENNL